MNISFPGTSFWLSIYFLENGRKNGREEILNEKLDGSEKVIKDRIKYYQYILRTNTNGISKKTWSTKQVGNA